MYAELYRWLILNKQLSLPGIGLFEIERKSATGDFLNRQMIAPSYAITMHEKAGQPSSAFFKWLGSALSVSERDAVIRFNDFLFDLKKQINNNDSIEWNGVGRLNKGLAGEIKFLPAGVIALENPVAAEKVIRRKAEHTVRVGEEEKTAVEMEELLGAVATKRSYWWIAPLVIALLAAGFIGWHIARNGFDVAAFGNTVKLKASETPDNQ
jgi:hypothetical protein